MGSSGTAELRLDFKNLPLVDAAVRASFDSPVQLTFRAVNQMAELLRPEFPQLFELDQFQVPPGVQGPVMLGAGQIPGAVYSGNRQGLSITIQSQLIVARWTKQLVPNAPDYPRFRALADALWRAVDCFRDTCEQKVPRIVVVNMSYVNFLRLSHDQPVLQRYFSEKVRVQAAYDARMVHKVEFSWQEQDRVDLRFRLEQETAKLETESVQGFRLTTAAGQRLDDGAQERTSLEVIHQRLQSLFLNALSEHAKAEWGLEPVNA